MSDTTALLHKLGLPRYEYLTLAQYQALAEPDANTLYFIKNTSLIYKGAAPYGSGVMAVRWLPDPADAVNDIQYFVTEGDEAGIYVVNGERDGYNCVTITQKHFNSVITEFVDRIRYDGETGDLLFMRPDGETTGINIPKANFLSAASFNAATNILTLTLSDETTVEVPLNELMNIYTGDSSNTADVSVDEDGAIKVDVKVSKDAGNTLTLRENGLYVNTVPVLADLDENVTDEQTVSAKLLYNLFSELAWKETR